MHRYLQLSAVYTSSGAHKGIQEERGIGNISPGLGLQVGCIHSAAVCPIAAVSVSEYSLDGARCLRGVVGESQIASMTYACDPATWRRMSSYIDPPKSGNNMKEKKR